ncbi:MAG: alpha/beta hydrolase family protein [Actinoallomurus sp.]
MPDSREVLTRPAPPPDVTLTYGPHPCHVMDVRLPTRLPAPLVVMIHGGFWRSAYDRMHTGPMTAALAAAGYAVAIPEFRRTGGERGRLFRRTGGEGGRLFGRKGGGLLGRKGGEGGWPETFDDIAAALDAVPGLLAPYSSDPPVVLGHSAGGHLALWAATRPDARMRAVVSLAGCADLTMCSELGLDDGATDLLMGGSPDRVPERYDLADPARLPVPAAPVTLLHGTADDRVPIEVGRSYAARTGSALHELPGVGHFALIDPLSPVWPRVLEAVSTGNS